MNILAPSSAGTPSFQSESTDLLQTIYPCYPLPVMQDFTEVLSIYHVFYCNIPSVLLRYPRCFTEISQVCLYSGIYKLTFFFLDI